MKPQKIVIKVCMDVQTSRFCCFGPRSSRSEAFRLASGFRGVQSVALVGDRDRIEVTGEVDAVELATLLRKKVGPAEIVSVGEAKKEGEKKDEKPPPVVWPYPRYEVRYVDTEPWCWPF